MSVQMSQQQITDFFIAIEESDVIRVQKLLNAGMSPNVINEYKMSALFIGLSTYGAQVFMGPSAAGSKAIVLALLDAGANPDFLGEHFRVNREYGSPLIYACSRGMVEMITLLLHHGANPAISSAIGNAAHHLLGLNLVKGLGLSHCVEITLEKMFDAGLSPGTLDSSGSTLFWYALRYHAPVSTFSLLLNYGVSPEAECRMGLQAIHMASLWGRSDVLGLLLARGISVDTSNSDGRTPLYYAQDVETVETLLELGADIGHVSNDGRTTFHSLIADYPDCRHIKHVLLYFLEKGIDSRRPDQSGQTALELLDERADHGNVSARELRHAIASLSRRAAMREVIAAAHA